MEVLIEDEFCFPLLPNISCRKPQQDDADNILVFLVLCFISFLTVALNLLVIISICHFRQLHTPANLLLLSLAVSDLLVGLLVMPIRIILIGGCWALGSFMCALFYYYTFVLTSASVGNMVLISVDRYVAICDPLCYPSKVTPARVKVCIGLCWHCSLMYNAVILKDFFKNPDAFNSCKGECVLSFHAITAVFDVVLTFFCPIIVIVVLYVRVFVVAVSQARAMRSHVKRIAQQGSVCATPKKSEVKAATALGVVVLVFLVCLFPYFFPAVAGLQLSSSAVLAIFLIWIFYFNSFLNPLIYAFFYPWFRKSLKHIVTLQILQPESCDARVL